MNLVKTKRMSTKVSNRFNYIYMMNMTINNIIKKKKKENIRKNKGIIFINIYIKIFREIYRDI